MSQLLCPLHSSVSPNSTLDSTADLPLPPLKVMLTATAESGLAMVTLQLPAASAVKGLEGDTVAPAGRPLTVMASPGAAVPKTRAGVTPPRQGEELASTMLLPKALASGPQTGARGGGSGDESSGSKGCAAAADKKARAASFCMAVDKKARAATFGLMQRNRPR